MTKETVEKFMTAATALKSLKNGQRVFVGSGAAEPQHLVSAFADAVQDLADIEVVHILTLGAAPYSDPKFKGKVRHNALFIGPNMRKAVSQGLADYTPCFLHEVPTLFSSGKLPLDLALVQVSLPKDGQYSLGVSVDVVKSAVQNAKYVIAQVNPQMPWVYGDACITVDDVDALVEHEEPLLELPIPKNSTVATWIGRYVARLIENGSTIQLGIGELPNAILNALYDKQDLGVHSEMISDGILALIEKGVVNGKCKSIHPGKIIVSFCMGSQELYNTVNNNPLFEFYPSDYVNDPFVVAKNHKMVSVNSALQIDLTGQVAADSIGHQFYSGVGGQVDFIRGAAGSKGGKSVIALPATAKSEQISRIVPALSEGAGVVTTRADIDFVVTEYGIASLKAKTIKERAIALIQIAHPKFRNDLIKAAKQLGFIEPDRLLPTDNDRYQIDLEINKSLSGIDVFFRPIKPTDERKLKELFYSQSDDTTFLRFGLRLKSLSEAQFQHLVAVDYLNSMAIAAFVKEENRERMIAVGRYYLIAAEEAWAEVAITVHDSYQGKGIGTFLVNYLTQIAKCRGLIGFKSQVLNENERMFTVFKRCFNKVHDEVKNEHTSVTVCFEDWKEVSLV